MSHHFDTPTARQDPRVNICDFYLFRGRPGTTVMAMTANPDAGLSARDTFHEEGLYAFRLDLNNDAREELTFKFQFSSVSAGASDEHRHEQKFEVRRATGEAARIGTEGQVIASGQTGETTTTADGVSVFAGLAPDMFAGDAAALEAFREAWLKKGKFDPAAFRSHKNYFAQRNVTAIVLELPTDLIGKGSVRAWATASLAGHAPEVQVSRFGLPLLTHMFIAEAAMREDYNRSAPEDDRARFAAPIASLAEHLVRLAGSVSDPAEYAKRLAARLCPTTLPYELDTSAAFTFSDINGRGLADDAMDVILTLATNTALGDGVAPDRRRVRDVFPYFGQPYTSAEQAAIAPHGPAAKN